MARKESWWLKLERADKHLAEVQEYLVAYEAKKAYRARLVPHPKGNQNIWRHVLEVTDEPDERLPLAIGDMVHNMRSALDHILVALRPRKERYGPGFPILTEDPWEGPLTDHKRREQEAFRRALRGVPLDAAGAVYDLQPYRSLAIGRDPRHHGLAVISRLDNADKHRERIVVVPGLVNVASQTTVRGEVLIQTPRPLPNAVGLLNEGADVSHFRWAKTPPLTEAEVNVQFSGTPLVALDVGIKAAYMPARETLATHLGWLWEDVIPVLEQELP